MNRADVVIVGAGASGLDAARRFSGYQLKIMQECITVVIFMVFASFYPREGAHWNCAVSFALILGAVGRVLGQGMTSARIRRTTRPLTDRKSPRE